MANEVDVQTVCQTVFGFSYRRYMQLAKDGVVPAPSRGKIDFVAACKAVIEYYRKMAEGHGELSLTDERRALTAIKREREKLKLEEEKKRLVDREKVKEWVKQIILDAKTAFRALPSRLAGRLVVLDDPREVEVVLRDEIDLILTELASQAGDADE